MSLVLAMLAQASMPAGSPPRIVLAPLGEDRVLTSSSIGRYACAGTTSDGTPLSFALVHGGGRLFTDPASGESAQTRDEIYIEGELGALFREYVFHKRSSRYRGETTAENAPLGKAIEIEFLDVGPPIGPEKSDRYAFVLAGFWDWMPLVRVVGFCNLSVTEQEPLTPQETEEYLAQ
jgi:hypothetical protein